MTKLLFRLSVIVAIAVVSVSAQGPRKPVQAGSPTPAEYVITAVVVSGQGVAMLGIEPNLDSPVIPSNRNRAFFEDFFGLRPQSPKRSLPKVLIRFAEEDTVGEITHAVDSVRLSPKIVVELASLTSNVRLIVPPKLAPADLTHLKPNPLTLIVAVDDANNVTLNGEPMGKLGDMSHLQSVLRGIYKEREQNGVFREETNDVEKTVFIKMTPKATAADLIKVAKALEDAGADRIGLQMDDLMDKRKDLVDIPLIPPKPGK